MRWSVLLVMILASAALAQAASTQALRIEVRPGQSLDAARDKARGHPGSTIILGGGTYVLDAPLMLTPADSHVTWESAPGQVPVLSGGRTITGWHATKLNGHNCFSAAVPQVKQGKFYFRAFWVNGRRAVRARSPNREYFRAVGSPDAGADWEQGVSRFQFSPGEIPGGKFSFGAEAIIGTRWVESRLPIVGVDAAKHIASFSRKSQWRIEPGDPYWLEGDRRWLDRPGEWFLDRDTGTLYYMPRQGETAANLHAIAPVLSNLVELNGDAKTGKFIEDVTFPRLSESPYPQDQPAEMPE